MRRPQAGSQPDAQAGDEPDSEREARAAVSVGIWISATRCVLTYVVAPVLGGFGVLLGPIGLVLQVLGAITSTAGAHRLWQLGHRSRYIYAAVATAVTVSTLASLLRLFFH